MSIINIKDKSNDLPDRSPFAFAASTLWAVQHLLSLLTRQLGVPTEVFYRFSEATMIDIALASFDPVSAQDLLPPYHDEGCSFTGAAFGPLGPGRLP